MNPTLLSRRTALQAVGGAFVLGFNLSAQSPSPALPLRNTGLEHFGLTVPDPEAAARFYGKIFDMQLFQEKDPPPRFSATCLCPPATR